MKIHAFIKKSNFTKFDLSNFTVQIRNLREKKKTKMGDNKINIINADAIDGYELKNITISQLDSNFNLNKTIKASSANIVKNTWILKNADIFIIGEPKLNFKNLELKTNFNIEKINNLFSDLSSLNFIELYNLYNDYKLFGYSTTEIESHFHKLYSMPIYLIYMEAKWLPLYHTKIFIKPPTD